MTETKDILPSFLNRLTYISESENEPPSEKLAARYYLNILKRYSNKDLRLQYGFARGVGGSGDNIVVMPLVERNEDGSVALEDNKLKTTHCIFNNFRSYLSYIYRRQPVRHGHETWMSLPIDLDGLPRDTYEAIWFRHQGIMRDRTGLDMF